MDRPMRAASICKRCRTSNHKRRYGRHVGSVGRRERRGRRGARKRAGEQRGPRIWSARTRTLSRGGCEFRKSGRNRNPSEMGARGALLVLALAHHLVHTRLADTGTPLARLSVYLFPVPGCLFPLPVPRVPGVDFAAREFRDLSVPSTPRVSTPS